MFERLAAVEEELTRLASDHHLLVDGLPPLAAWRFLLEHQRANALEADAGSGLSVLGPLMTRLIDLCELYLPEVDVP